MDAEPPRKTGEEVGFEALAWWKSRARLKDAMLGRIQDDAA